MKWPVAWLTAGSALAAAVLSVGLVLPAGQVIGDLAVVVAELGTAVLLVAAGRRHRRGLRGWGLLAVALVVPVAWIALTPDGTGARAVTTAYFSWTPTIPAYLLAIAGSLTFLERAQLRAAGRRVAVELALFTSACLIAAQLLMLGPDARWATLPDGQRLTLAAAVATMAAAMATGLTLARAVQPRRRPMARALLAGSVLLATGQGCGSSPALAAWAPGVDIGRFLVVLGLAALGAAVLVDPGPGPEADDRCRWATGGGSVFGWTAPHIAMVFAVLLVVGATLLGHRPTGVTFGGVALCAILAAVHRWLSATAERRLGVLLRRREGYFRSLVQSATDAVLILDGGLTVTWASPAFERVLGPAAADLAGRQLLDAVHPEDVAVLTAAVPSGGQADTEQAATTGLMLLRLRDSAGTWRFLEAALSDLRRDPDVGAVVLHCRDMTERNAREEALTRIAYTDPMTGLPNRAGWLQALDRAVAEQDTGQPSALLLVELEGLAEAREQVSRDVVTTIVGEIGRRLRDSVRGEDLLARLGGGAFAVLAAGSPAEADQLARRCLDVVEQPIATPAGVLEITASVGVAPLEPGLSVEGLRSRAELAVRAARAAGQGSAARYSAAMGDAATRRDRLREDLAGAHLRGELSLLFQPVVSLTEQRIVGIEALLRWQHPALGQIPPAEFVPIAERAGLIGELQRWVLNEAARTAAELPAPEPAPRIGVNLSVGYLAGGTVVADVEAALRLAGLAPERLILELPEGAALVDQESVALDVGTLRLMGVHVSLDDFGSGPSGLGSLTRLPWDVLKLDVSLIARIDRDPQARALCESIVGIGRALGLDVVAEGVETPAQLAALCAAGCGFAQGFLISRPMPLGEFTALLRDGAGALWPGLVASQ